MQSPRLPQGAAEGAPRGVGVASSSCLRLFSFLSNFFDGDMTFEEKLLLQQLGRLASTPYDKDNKNHEQVLLTCMPLCMFVSFFLLRASVGLSLSFFDYLYLFVCITHHLCQLLFLVFILLSLSFFVMLLYICLLLFTTGFYLHISSVFPLKCLLIYYFS